MPVESIGSTFTSASLGLGIVGYCSLHLSQFFITHGRTVCVAGYGLGIHNETVKCFEMLSGIFLKCGIFFISFGEINSCPNVCSLMSLCGNKAAAWKWYKQTKDIGGKKVIKVRIPDSNQYLQNIYKNFFKKHTVFLKTVTPASYCQWRKSWCGTVALSNNYICILLITCVVYKRAM